MKYLYWSLIIFLSFFLQGRISVLGISPDLTALLAYYAGIKYRETKGLLLGAVIGALEDSISLSILGPNMLSKGIIGFSSSVFITGGFFRWTPLLGIIFISLLTLIDKSVVFLSRSLFDNMPATFSTALFVSLMQALLNAPAGIFIRPKHAE